MSSADSQRRLGAQRVGDYLLLEQIGQGAMATVYRARELRSEREVALKLGAALSPARLERFRREGEITASLNHPNIVRVHGAGVFESRPYLVYQFVEGAQTLSGALAGWPLRRRIEALRDVARALGYAHRRGIVHRDVKPDNVLVARDGTILLADFGLATAETLDRMTRSGVMLGTPLYMAPEHAKTVGKSVQPQADVYSLGVMLYEALTGEHPYRHGGLAAIVDPKQRSFQTPAERERSVSPGLSAICMRALARDADQRYPSGVELAAALETWLVQGDAPRSLRGPLALGLLVLGALVGAAGLTLTRGAAPSSPAPTPSASVAATPPAGPSPRDPKLQAALAALSQRLQARPVNDPDLTLALRELRGKLSSSDEQARTSAEGVILLLLDRDCQWERWGLTCLEALAETGARPRAHGPAATLCEQLWAVHSISQDFGDPELNRALVALVVLDVDVEGVKHAYPPKIPAPESAKTPSERYLRLRAQLEAPARPRDALPAYAQLVTIGQNKELGPVTRARALSEGSLSLRSPQERLARLTEAKELDPESPTVALFYAYALLWSGAKARGWEQLQEAWARWRGLYRARQGAYAMEGDHLDLSLRFLLRQGLLAEATQLEEESRSDPLWIPAGGGDRARALSGYREGDAARFEAWFETGGPTSRVARPRRR